MEKHSFCIDLANSPENCAFPQNFNTRKCGEIMVFLAVQEVLLRLSRPNQNILPKFLPKRGSPGNEMYLLRSYRVIIVKKLKITELLTKNKAFYQKMNILNSKCALLLFIGYYRFCKYTIESVHKTTSKSSILNV